MLSRSPQALVLDYARSVALIADRRPPQWSTPHEVTAEWPLARLRDFSRGSRARIVPTLVLPPQAGHDSCIVDFGPDQSQMAAIRAAGLTRAWSLDWIGATQDTRDAAISDYIAIIDAAVEQLGGRVNVIGDCQGGWLAAIYAALRPHRVHTLTLAGAPIDFHAGEPLIGAWLRTLAPGGDLMLYQSLVAAHGGVMKGEYLLAGFIALRPQDELAKQLGVLRAARDPAAADRYRRFEDWYKHTQDLPGRFYLWIVEHLFRDNELVAGELEVGGERVDLRRITCPLNLIAGAKDHITPPDQVFAAAGATGTAPADVFRRLSGGGHLGLFMGRGALSEHWPPVLERIRAGSRL
jgi:poly(3-hydroxyalkanoate) synthetase